MKLAQLSKYDEGLNGSEERESVGGPQSRTVLSSTAQKIKSRHGMDILVTHAYLLC